MTTWTHSPNEVSANWSHTSEDANDIISPYGDFNASTDITKFWDTSLSSVTTEYIASVTIDSGALKILGDTTSNNHIYIKAIPVVTGRSYTLSGDSIAGSGITLILGGSTSGGHEYFSLLVTAFPDDWEDDILSGSLTFTATSDTFYLTFTTLGVSSYYVSGDNISLEERILWSSVYNELKWNVWGNETTDNWSDWG